MTLVFAHRGFSGKYPENTMLAFRKAVEAGCDGIELDVHFTKDKELVIIHDEEIDRTCINGTGFVCDYTLEELKQFDVSFKFKDMGFNGIPTLREYFEYIKDKDVITNIEIKTNKNEYPGIEQAIADMITEFDLKDKINISSFNYYSVLRYKAIMPDMPCGVLEESWIPGWFELVKRYNVEFVNPMYNMINEEFIKEAAEGGFGINTFTPNTREVLEDLVKKGVRSVITNFPDLGREVVDGYKA